jgi:hypothetical protein
LGFWGSDKKWQSCTSCPARPRYQLSISPASSSFVVVDSGSVATALFSVRRQRPCAKCWGCARRRRYSGSKGCPDQVRVLPTIGAICLARM